MPRWHRASWWRRRCARRTRLTPAGRGRGPRLRSGPLSGVVGRPLAVLPFGPATVAVLAEGRAPGTGAFGACVGARMAAEDAVGHRADDRHGQRLRQGSGSRPVPNPKDRTGTGAAPANANRGDGSQQSPVGPVQWRSSQIRTPPTISDGPSASVNRAMAASGSTPPGPTITVWTP